MAIPCSLISARCVMYRAQMIKNVEKKNNRIENSIITHKGSLEVPKIANVKAQANKGKKAKNQTLNITAEEYTFKMFFFIHIPFIVFLYDNENQYHPEIALETKAEYTMADLPVVSITTALKNSFDISLNKFLDQPPKVLCPNPIGLTS